MIIVGNYNLFAPLLLTPRPCRGGAGVGSAFFARTQYLPCPSIFFLDITDPTPIPSPTGAGKHCVRHLLEHYFIYRVKIVYTCLIVLQNYKKNAFSDSLYMLTFSEI